MPEHPSDHDILVRLEENVRINFDQVKADIKELKDGTQERLNNHGERIGRLEAKVSKYFITLGLYSLACGFMIALIIYHIAKQ